jgi:hypothetical protein
LTEEAGGSGAGLGQEGQARSLSLELQTGSRELEFSESGLAVVARQERLANEGSYGLVVIGDENRLTAVQCCVQTGG